jgi:phospholipase A1
VAYTQLSFWQLYNSAFSSPFRDTNYEPEMLINWRTKYSILDDFKLQFVNVGFNHQSNGRSLPLSRSWNRVVANAGFEKDNFNLLLKTWYRIPEEDYNDDNPDITRYMGYGELWGIYYWKENRFAIMVRNNLRQNNLGAVQLDWSIPMSLIVKKFYDWGVPLSLETCDKLKDFSFYFQYFNGYGESLLDYNTSINRFSAGMMLVDWN